MAYEKTNPMGCLGGLTVTSCVLGTPGMNLQAKQFFK